MLKDLKNTYTKTSLVQNVSLLKVDTLVPMLQHTITLAGNEGIKNIQIGMAHRGRLNVLTHVLENHMK